MEYLTGEEILVIHSKIIEKTGGLHGVRDVGLLSSIIQRPKIKFNGKELYKGVFKKAATYLESLAMYHIFIDGNKRTSITVTARFLFVNSYELKSTNKEIEEFVLGVVIQKLPLKIIASWLKTHSRKIQKRIEI